jgi:hypothetical protein
MSEPSTVRKDNIGVESTSTSKALPTGISTASPSPGIKSPPQVSVSDQRATYMYLRPLVATLPFPSIDITKLGCSSEMEERGLSAVVQVIVVLEESVTRQVLSSIRTVGVPEKPEPVKTTVSEPFSDPYLGVIASR